MSEPEPPDAPKQPPDDGPGKGDLVAVGIGCAVFVIMFIAIVLVGIGQR